MIRTVLIDDELPATERLTKLLKPYSNFDIVGTAQDGVEALALIAEKKPDVVFLDIDMPELSGLEVAQTLGVSGPLIVFVTAYDEFALTAFESSAIDYLVKPINSQRFDFAIDKIQKNLGTGRNNSLERVLTKFSDTGRPSRLAVKVGSKYEVFDPSLISVAVAKDHYTSLLIEGRELLTDDTLEALMRRLDPELFIRVHRSAAVNIKFLKELRREGDRKYTAILADSAQSQVPVSRERLSQLMSFLGVG